MTYQRVILSGPTIDGPPGLPPALVGLADESLMDLAAALNPCPEEFDGIGYWPIQPAVPTPEGKIVIGRDRAFVDGVLMWVEEIEDAPPPPFPELTGRQVLLGLLAIDITEEDVDAVIDLIEDPAERRYAQIEWKKAVLLKRHHPLVDSLATAFSLPSEQVDTLWRWAAGL
jgi:hypothetical protein